HKQLLARKDLPSDAKARVAAEFAFYREDYLKARDLALESLRSNSEDARTLNLAAKTLLKLRDFKSALKFFEKAKAYSPANVERLCLMAEAKLELNDTTGASEALDQASKVDADNLLLKETTAKVNLAKGDVQGCKDVLHTLESIAT